MNHAFSVFEINHAFSVMFLKLAAPALLSLKFTSAVGVIRLLLDLFHKPESAVPHFLCRTLNYMWVESPGVYQNEIGGHTFMSQSLARLWTHLIFSTKNRFPFLSDKKLRTDMHAYLAKVLHEQA